MYVRVLSIVCVAMAATIPLRHLGSAARQTVVGRTDAATSAVPPALTSTSSAMARAVTELARVGTRLPAVDSFGGLRMFEDATPIPTTVSSRDIFDALKDLPRRIELTRTSPNETAYTLLNRSRVTQELYLALETPNNAENRATYLMSQLIADLHETIGTAEFDDMNISRLVGPEPGAPSANERFLLAAAAIGQGQFADARSQLDVLGNFKSTLATGRSDLLLKYRAALAYMEGADPATVAYPSAALSYVPNNLRSLKLATRVPATGPVDALLRALYRFDARTMSVPYGDTYPTAGLFATHRLFEPNTFGGDSLDGFWSPFDGGRTLAAKAAAKDAVEVGDVATAADQIGIIRSRYADAIAEGALSPERIRRYDLNLEKVADGAAVLARRFRQPDEPFYKEPELDYFVQQREIGDLPYPMRKLVTLVDGWIQKASDDDAVRAPLYAQADLVLNAIFEGRATTGASRKLVRDINAVKDLIKPDFEQALVDDATRFSGYYQAGRNAGWVDPNSVLVPDAVIDGFTGNAKRAMELITEVRNDVELQPGFYPFDLYAVTAKLIEKAQNGEDVEVAYRELMRPMLAYPDHQIAPRGSRRETRSYEQKNLLELLRTIKPSP